MTKNDFVALGVMVLALGACQAGVEPALRPTAKSAVPVTQTLTPPPPVALSPQPPGVTFALLQKPGFPYQEISGALYLDAAYLTSKAKARVLANQGGNAVAVGPAELIADAGGVILSNNGSGMISKIRSNGGGGELISKLRYGLLEEPAQGEIAALSIGTILPAAGMAIAAQSMRTGQFLPIGADAAGQPVYAIASNATGAYTLYLPAEERGNVLIMALAPASTDEKLTYSLVTPTRKQAERVIDEDSALVTSYILRVVVAHMTTILSDESAGDLDDLFQFVASSPAIRELVTAANAVGIKDAPRREKHALAVRISTTMLARLDLATIEFMPGKDPQGVERPAAPALATLVGLMRTLREATRNKLLAEPNYFVGRPYLVTANLCLAPAERFEIQRPTDLGEFFIRAYLTGQSLTGFEQMQTVWSEVVGDSGAAQARPYLQMRKSINALLKEVLGAFVANKDGVADEARASIRGFKVGQPNLTDESSLPLPPSVCPLASPSVSPH